MAIQTMPFASEADAVEYVERRLQPYCLTLEREPRFSDGYRPDLGIRLRALPEVPICIEVKQFDGHTQIRRLSDGVAQANFYAQRIGTVAFIAPFVSVGGDEFHENSRVAGAFFIAAQFSVGALCFHPRRYMTRFVIGGQNAVTLYAGAEGEMHHKLHPLWRNLLSYKNRKGSQTWRALAS